MLNPKSEDKYTDFVRDNLLVSDLYLALAEEASELAQAAAKQARILIGNNPSPVSQEDGESNVLEELADVYVCANVLYGKAKDDYVSDVIDKKLARWVSRLSDNEYVTDVQTDTGYKDVFGQVVYVGDVLYGNTDNKSWKVIGTTPEHVPYTLHVQNKHGTTRNVIPKWMSHTPWDFDTPVTLRDGNVVMSGNTCYCFGKFSPVTLVSHNRNIACVKLSGVESRNVVYVRDLSLTYWDSYDKVVDDIVKYKDNPKTYCEQFNLIGTLEYTDKLTATSRMRHHLGERLQRL